MLEPEKQPQPQTSMPAPYTAERPERRSYTYISNEKRNELIALLQSEISIKNAAEQVDINYECAKAVYRTYRLQNRKLSMCRKKEFNRQFRGENEVPERLVYFKIHRKRHKPTAEHLVEQTKESITSKEDNLSGTLHSRLPPIKKLAGYKQWTEWQNGKHERQARYFNELKDSLLSSCSAQQVAFGSSDLHSYLSTSLEVEESCPDFFAVNTTNCVRSHQQSFKSASSRAEAVFEVGAVGFKDALPLKQSHALFRMVTGRELMSPLAEQPAQKRARYHAN